MSNTPLGFAVDKFGQPVASMPMVTKAQHDQSPIGAALVLSGNVLAAPDGTGIGASAAQVAAGGAGAVLMISRTATQLAAAPSATDIAAGPQTVFYLSTDATQTYQVSPDGANYVAVGVTAAAVSTACLSVSGFGDSLTTYWNQFLTPTAMVRASNVTTITATAHGLATGQKVRVFGVRSDTSFNVSDVAVTRVDANNVSYPNIGPNATATLDANYVRVTCKNWFSNVSPYMYANSRMKGAMTLVENYGQSTEQTTDMILRLAEVAASSADVIIYLAGSNDATGTSGVAALPTATTIANDLTICKTLLAAGKIVVLCTTPPLGTGHASFATATPKLKVINAARKALATLYHGRIRLCDFYDALVDPATGGALANALQADNVHWQTYGARLAGAELSNALTGIPLGRFLCASISDAKGNYATSDNIWGGATNYAGQFTQVDAGSKSGPTNAASPPGGSVAGTLDGYNVTCTSGAGEVWMVPDVDGYGYGQAVSWTPSGAGTVTIQQESAATMNGYMVAGDHYQIGFHLKVAGVTAPITFLRCRVQGIFDGVTLPLGSPMHSVVGASNNLKTDFDEYIIGPVMIVPTNGWASCTSLTLEVIVNFSGVTTQFITTVSRMTFKKVP